MKNERGFMKKMKFVEIHDTLLDRILSKEYEFQSLLPTENELTTEFNVARNTVRRAISLLNDKGYVQSIHGKGVMVIHKPIEESVFQCGVIESFKETTERLNKKFTTEVLEFETILVKQKLSEISNFQIGSLVYHIKRLRFIDDTPVIIDESYFSKNLIKNLTKKIAKESIYDYLENKLKIKISGSKRNIKVIKKSKDEENLIPNSKFSSFVSVASYTYDSLGNLLEYTVSKHDPQYFSFDDYAIRKK